MITVYFVLSYFYARLNARLPIFRIFHMIHIKKESLNSLFNLISK